MTQLKAGKTVSVPYAGPPADTIIYLLYPAILLCSGAGIDVKMTGYGLLP